VKKSLLLWLGAALLMPGESSNKPRIAVGGISHESDSFSPMLTRLSDFGWPAIRTADFLPLHEKASTTIAGYIEGARRYGLELIPTLWANATPAGPLTDDAFNALSAELIARLKAVPKLDGVLLALHGAMVVESYPHGDEELMRRLRAALGRRLPIMVVHDFHANVSPEMVDLTTVLLTFKECPHLDPKERGIQTAGIMADTVRGKVRPVQALAKPPMILNIIHHDTYKLPLKPIVDASKALEKEPGVLAASVPGGYQWGDVPWVGPGAIVVTDNNPGLAKREAERLMRMLMDLRPKLGVKLPDAAEAVRLAMASERFPVALLDTGDNIGGGSAGDSTFILEELLRQKAQGWVVVLADPAAVEAAIRAGVGGSFDMAVGGKTDSFHGRPVAVRGRVRSLHAGQYIETEVRHGGGRYYDMGRTAVIEAEGSTRDLPNLLLVTTRRSSPNSLHQLISNGVYPERQKILVAKGTIAPRAAYEPVAARLIEVDTPGVTAVNPKRFKYTRVRAGLFGLD
jgi:microcystin degradation protein MlrC